MRPKEKTASRKARRSVTNHESLQPPSRSSIITGNFLTRTPVA